MHVGMGHFVHCREVVLCSEVQNYEQAEISSHEPRLMAVCSNGERMTSMGHYGATEITNKISQLKSRWQSLKDSTQSRQQILDEALQAQQYYSSAQEVESWIKEKEPIVGSGDYGKDEDSAQVRYDNKWGFL